MNTIEKVDAVFAELRSLLEAKNHDYDEAWRDMLTTSIADIIKNKAKRVIKMEHLKIQGKEPMVSEGVRSELRDIMGYCALAIVKIDEEGDGSTR